METVQEESKIEVCCTRCQVELSACLTPYEHPHLEVAVCGECKEEVEEAEVEDWEDWCAWCVGSGEARLALCDNPGCARPAWCEECLRSQLGEAYAARVFDGASDEEWRCPACADTEESCPSSLVGLRQKLRELARASRTLSENAEARLWALESEMAETQERLEPESLDRRRAEVEGEVGAGEVATREMATYAALWQRKLDVLEREQAAAQEAAEAAGVDLRAFYARLEAVNASGRGCETDAWRRAASVKARKRGRVARALQDAVIEEEEDEDDDDDDDDAASYDRPSDPETKEAIEAAEAELDRVRPLKKKRGAGGVTTLVGKSVGATGFDAIREQTLGATVYKRVYEADRVAETSEALADTELADQADAIDELDPDWRAAFSAEDVAAVERNERDRAGARAKIKTVKEADDRDIARRRVDADAERYSRTNARSVSRTPAESVVIVKTPIRAPRAAPPPDDGDMSPGVYRPLDDNGASLSETGRSGPDADGPDDRQAATTAKRRSEPVSRPPKRLKAADELSDFVVARRRPNVGHADAMLYIPARDDNQVDAEHLVRVPADGYVTLGRTPHRLDEVAKADPDYRHFVELCDSSNVKVSRKLARVSISRGQLVLKRCVSARTAVRVDDKYVDVGDAVRIQAEIVRVRIGKPAQDDDAEKTGGKQTPPNDVHAYFLLPTAADDFVIPEYDPDHFANRRSGLSSSAHKTPKASTRGSTGRGTADEPIFVDGDDDADRNRAGRGATSPVRGGFKMPKRKELKAIADDDDDDDDEAKKARKAEHAKRKRLESRQRARRHSDKLAAASQQSMSPSRIPEGAEPVFEADAGAVAVKLNGDDEDADIRVPSYLAGKLKPHQIEAARFMYDQTIESLDMLEKAPAAEKKALAEGKTPDPFGCVLAHSMGLGKTLSCVAYLATLLLHPRAKKFIRTALVVAPTNVITSWKKEFLKWCDGDRRITNRVFVVHSKLDPRERMREIERWTESGGVCVIGYELFSSLTDEPKPPAEAREASDETLDDMCARGALGEGVGAVRVDDRPDLAADVLVGGVIAFGAATFRDPVALCEAMTGDGARAWDRISYLGKPLSTLRGKRAQSSGSGSDGARSTIAADAARKRCEKARKALQDPGPDVLVLDEAHLVKEPTSKRAKALSKVRTRRRVALTGTPLQNNLMEYYAMITFVRGNVLGTRAGFKARFEEPIKNGMCVDSIERDVVQSRRRTAVLLRLVKDFVLRRDQELLAKEVEKTEYMVITKFTDLQRRLYRAFLSRTPSAERKVIDMFPPVIKLGNNPVAFFFDKNAAAAAAPEAIGGVLPEALEPAPLPEVKAPDALDDVEALTDDVLNDGVQFNDRKKKKKRGADDDDDDSIDLLSDDDEQDEDSGSGTGDSGVGDVADVADAGAAAATVADAVQEPADGDDDDADAEKKTPFHGEVLAAVARHLGVGPGSTPSDMDVAASVALSSKTAILFDILARCLAVDDKVVVFSQSLPTLSYLEHVLSSEAWVRHRASIGGVAAPDGERPWKLNEDYLRLDGHVGAVERQRMVEQFERPDGAAKVFLISTKAGNMGITLVRANRVVLFDTSWNPANDRQALFRCFRYGQKKHVYVYRLVCQGFEDKIRRRAMHKEILSLRVIDDRACERIFTLDDLNGGANVDDDADDDVVDQEVTDTVLFDTLQSHSDHIVSHYVTDTLFRDNEEERLNEDEYAEALDDYQREKSGLLTKAQEARQAGVEQTIKTGLLPPNWYDAKDPATGNTYYYNQITKQVVWERPTI